MKNILSSKLLLISVGVIGISFNILYVYTNLFAPKDAPRVKQTYAATAGPNSPSTITSDVAASSTTWTNPTNALTSNNVYTTNTGTSTYYLSATGFGFAIPATAVIDNFLVEVEGKSSVGATPFINGACIIVAGVRSCNAATMQQPHFSTTEQYMSVGIDNNWTQYGNTSYPATAAQVNASNFGFAIQVVNSGGETVSVDHIRLTVNYTTQAAPTMNTLPLSTIHDTDAVLKGQAYPAAQATNAFFKWGTSNVACSSLANTTGNVAVGTGNGNAGAPIQYGTSITGLSANTTYYYCAAGTNASGTSYGTVSSFTTTGGANPIQSVSAAPGTISGQGASCPSRAGWTNTANMSTSDNIYATSAPTYPSPSCGNTGDITGSNFGFNIPAGASILGVSVDVEGKNTTGIDSWNARLYQTASNQTGVWGQTYPAVNTVESVQSSGGQSDMAGGAWTAAIVNNSAFGVLLQNIFIGYGTYSIDQMRLTIYYTSNPTITSPTKTSIGGTSVTLGGNVTNQGASAITGRGVCYSTSDSTPQLSEGGVTCVSTSGTTGVFTVPVSGLSQVTNYYYTAYATNTQGTSYTSPDSFTTLNVNPTGVGTDPGSNVNSYFVTLNGAANPNGYATVGHFRVFPSNPNNCNSDTGGFRFPPIAPQDISVGSDTSPHNFSFTIPYNSGTFLTPNTKYWYCSYAVNTNGTVGGSSVQNFTTSDGPSSPCDAPASGNLDIPAGAACSFSGQFNGVDSGTGGTNTAVLTLNTGNQITLNPGQKIARGTLSLRGGSMTLAAGSGTPRSGVFVHDKDGDGILDDQTQYVVSTASAANEFVRRNTISSTYNYAWKIASSGASFDCNTNSAYVNRYIPGIQMYKDADNDGYRTSAVASTQCVGQQSVINGRTYYKDTSNNYSWIASTAVLGGGAIDCQDDPNGGACAPVNAAGTNGTDPTAVAASTTQINLSWGVNSQGGAVPAPTGYTVRICGLNDTTCSSSTTQSVSAATFTYSDSGIACSTSPAYYYRITAVHPNGSPNSNIFSGITSTCASAPTVTTNAASNPTVTGGTLNGTFAMNNGTSNQFWFRYGTSNVACSSLPSATTATSFGSDGAQSQSLTGLAINTTYYFCAVASNSVGTTYGSVTSFTTAGPSQIYTTPGGFYYGSVMVVPSDNMPVIMTSKGLYKCDDTSCTTATQRSATYKTTANSTSKSLALANDGLPVGVDIANNQLFKCTTVACSAFNTAALGSAISNWASVAVPSDNFPIIAYNGGGTGGTIKIVKCTSATCSTKNAPVTLYTGTATTDPAGQNVSVIIGSDNLPLIAFGRDNYGVQVIHCGNSTCSSGNASTLALTLCAGGSNPYCYPAYISLAKASDGFGIFTANTNYNSCGAPNPNSCQTYVTKCNNAACTAFGSVPLGTNFALTSITVSATDGRPVIGLGNYSNPFGRIIKCGDSSCSSGNVTTSYVTTGGNNSWGLGIGINSSNIPFFHYENTSAGFVIKCANSSCN